MTDDSHGFYPSWQLTSFCTSSIKQVHRMVSFEPSVRITKGLSHLVSSIGHLVSPRGRWHQIDGEDKQNLLWEWNPTLPHPQTLHSESSRWGPTKRYCGCRTNKRELEKIFVTFHGFLGSGRMATVTTAAIQASWRIPTFCVMSPLNQMPLMHLQMFEIFEEKYLKYSTSHF